MKLAVIGTGKIVQEALPVLQEIDGLHLQALLSTPRSLSLAENLWQKYGFAQVTSDADDVFANPAVDTVYVAVPNHLHYDYAKRALLAGKHVICEKPFTLTLAEFEDLAKLAQQSQLILLEAITNQYLGNFSYIKDKLSSLGEIKIVECNYSQYSSRYDAFKKGEIAPAFDPAKGGGALRDLNIYNIHLLVGLFGQPKVVNYLSNIERGVDTSGILVMDYEKFKAVCIGAKDCSAPIRSTLQGNQGSLIINGATNTIPSVTLAINHETNQTVNVNSPHHRMYDEFLAFERMIAEQDILAAQKALEHSRAVMTVLDKASQQF